MLLDEEAQIEITRRDVALRRQFVSGFLCHNSTQRMKVLWVLFYIDWSRKAPHLFSRGAFGHTRLHKYSIKKGGCVNGRTQRCMSSKWRLFDYPILSLLCFGYIITAATGGGVIAIVYSCKGGKTT